MRQIPPIQMRIVLLGLIITGCDQADSNTNAPIPVAKASPLGAIAENNTLAKKSLEPVERLIGGIRFQIPVDWEEKPLASTVILAEYSLPSKTGPARLTMSTAGGGMTANLDRWKEQFRRTGNDPEPKETRITACGKEASLLEVQGTFTDMFGGGGQKPNWQLLGIAIPLDTDHNYFVKLTGPADSISERREEFLKAVQSARFE